MNTLAPANDPMKFFPLAMWFVAPIALLAILFAPRDLSAQQRDLLPLPTSGNVTLSLDELIVTYFTMSPETATLPIKVFGMAKVGLNPMLNAISTIFILATVAFVLLAEWIRRASR